MFGYDINFGARPLKRTIQDEVETLVSRGIVADEIKKKDNIKIYCKFNNTKQPIDKVICKIFYDFTEKKTDNKNIEKKS